MLLKQVSNDIQATHLKGHLAREKRVIEFVNLAGIMKSEPYKRYEKIDTITIPKQYTQQQSSSFLLTINYQYW